jgi:GGDEF domain-containing protein
MINTVTASAPVAPGPARIEIAFADWDALYDAVTTRLTRLGEQGADRPADDTAAALGTDVLDCVQALRQLQAALAHELHRRQRLQADAVYVRALMLARAQGLGLTAPVVPRRARRRVGDTGDQGDMSDTGDAGDMGDVADRPHFQARLTQVLAPRARPAGLLQAVLLLGMDGHQAVDAVHGPGVAAQLLRVVGARLLRGLRRQDMVSGPWGDDYACLLTDVPGREQLSHLACKVFDLVAAPICVGALQLSLRPTIGIAASPGDADGADDLLHCAEVARHNARRHGSGYAFFDPAQGLVTALRQSA